MICVDNKDFEADTWRVVLDYALNENTLIYGSIATGYVGWWFHRNLWINIYLSAL